MNGRADQTRCGPLSGVETKVRLQPRIDPAPKRQRRDGAASPESRQGKPGPAPSINVLPCIFAQQKTIMNENFSNNAFRQYELADLVQNNGIRSY
jgi:hypothetical protein